MEGQNSETKNFINTVIAKNHEDEMAVREYFEDLYTDPQVSAFERDKTSEEILLIEEINKNMQEFLAEYGVQFKKVLSSNVHIADWDKLPSEQKDYVINENMRGVYMMKRQSIVLIPPPDSSRLHDVHDLVHEILHAQSFQSVESRADSERNMTPVERRIGLQITPSDRKNDENNREYFGTFDEAIIEELTKQFCKKHFSQMQFTRTDQKLSQGRIEEQKLKGEEIMEFYSRKRDDEQWEAGIVEFVYQKERRRLSVLIDTIFQKASSGEYDSRADVFKLFVQAEMSGQLLPLARVIERTFGKGSFKYLAEITKKQDKV